jgi:NADH-quinone oxidoreductase subunit C
MNAAALIEILQRLVPGATFEIGPATDQPTVYVDREHLVETCRALRDDSALQFALLVEVTAADYLPREPRFEVVYHLVCLGAAFSTAGPIAPARLRLKVRVKGAAAHVPTVSGLWPAAGWLEREVWDLFGIVFDGHTDLRRLLTPEDWEGHPLRKDYPVQIRKSAQATEALQLSPEQFAANIVAARRRSER